MNLYKLDCQRYKTSSPPAYLLWIRLLQEKPNSILRPIYKVFNKFLQFLYNCEISYSAKIGAGIYIGHPFGITINPKAIIGINCNIHKGVTIGRENRGKRDGAPQIGNNVWIGVNSTIVGSIIIGEDVLIAPNSFVNCDIPSHSIVFGNPCIIKKCDKATDKYINHSIDVF